MDDLCQKVWNGERITQSEAVELSRLPLQQLGALSDRRRQLAKADDYSLLPFLKSADLMISDASSAIIEFAALNKPVLWCTFLQLRWNYRGIFSYRFKARMDKDYDDYG